MLWMLQHLGMRRPSLSAQAHTSSAPPQPRSVCPEPLEDSNSSCTLSAQQLVYGSKKCLFLFFWGGGGTAGCFLFGWLFLSQGFHVHGSHHV